jgi:hypothetical protein
MPEKWKGHFLLYRGGWNDSEKKMYLTNAEAEKIDREDTRPPEVKQQHPLLHKSPWVDRAEKKELPAKEMTNGNG